MTEFSDNELQHAHLEIEDAQRLRGWISNSYAQIEFLLGDLILRCREFSEYDELTKTLPHGAPDRVKRVRRILAINGPISRFSEGIEQVMQQFESRHDVRNLLAHGFCTYLTTPHGDTGFHFQKWHRQPDRIDARLVRTFRMTDLQREQEDIVLLSQNALTLFYSMHDHFGWVERSVQ